MIINKLPQLILFIAIACNASPPVIAIADLSSDGSIEREKLSQLQSSVVSQLDKTKLFDVVNVETLRLLYSTQISSDEYTCLSQKCIEWIGEKIKADAVVFGSIISMGEKEMVRLDVFSLKDRETIASVESQGMIDVAFSNCVDSVVPILSKNIHKETSVSSENYLIDLENIQSSKSDVVLLQRSKELLAEDAISDMRNSRMTTRKKVALSFLGGSVLSVFGGIHFNNAGDGYKSDYYGYVEARNISDMRAAESNIKEMESYRNISYGFSMGFLAIGLYLWFTN